MTSGPTTVEPLPYIGELRASRGNGLVEGARWDRSRDSCCSRDVARSNFAGHHLQILASTPGLADRDALSRAENDPSLFYISRLFVSACLRLEDKLIPRLITAPGDRWRRLLICSSGHCSVVQTKKAVTSYFSSEQLLPVGFAFLLIRSLDRVLTGAPPGESSEGKRKSRSVCCELLENNI